MPLYLTETWEPSGKDTCIGLVTIAGLISREKSEHI